LEDVLESFKPNIRDMDTTIASVLEKCEEEFEAIKTP
jgi:hypothetical protein